ncbi:PREDICTED: uncharacterized protein LOC105363094 [Ceratosolen solmsi marchali]|uniref:Uncharacterized protein LOC105363094 n=1 Tax=Ceratosolen solmsi marchali TaxID=326594 RepID=A0AAJ7DWI3_9HYME|nr:PREDICTED: uncharacterized protein LOC105363094 [Ceratosolen solmsi marchali]
MSKRYGKSKVSSPAKKVKLDVTRQPNVRIDKKSSHSARHVEKGKINDLWGDDFGEEEIEEMDFIASQATQEEVIFIPPKPKGESNRLSKNLYSDAIPSTSSGFRGGANLQKDYSVSRVTQSQVLGCSDVNKEIIESTQAIVFDDFESNIKSNSHNSTFLKREDSSSNNVVLVSDDDQVEKWKEEKQKLLEDFMTKEGETEFLRQQLFQIQMRAENAKKEQTRLMEEQVQKLRGEISGLLKEKTALETQLQLQGLQFNSVSEKCKLLESGSIKFTQPQITMVKASKDKSNLPVNWMSKKVKTKESSVQVEQRPVFEFLKTTIIHYPLKKIPQCIFEPCEPEKSVIIIKLEEKIGKKNLAIIQEEETFRIFENPELSKPKFTIVNGQNLSTEFFLPDLVKLVNKTQDEINSSDTIPILNKLIATTRELLLNSTLVLQKISQGLQNDDIRDMNELYLSEYYEMPVLHTRSVCEARPWYDLERGIETRRAFGVLSYVSTASKYLADYVAGNVKLKTDKDSDYDAYACQMKSYDAWYKKGFEFEFLELILEFVTVIGTIRRSHQFTGLINAILTLITNVQKNVGFSPPELKRACTIVKEIIYSRPLLSCFLPICNTLKEFSQYTDFVNKLCIAPDKCGINYWKGSLNFTLDSCALEIFIAQLDNFKIDPISIISITSDLAIFSKTALLKDSIPWLEKTTSSCNCCLNLLKFIVINLNECSKINVEELKDKYIEADISWRISKHGYKMNKIVWKNQINEDWKSFEQSQTENFWKILELRQSAAIAYGIRLLSYLAKRDLDFMIRLTDIEDAFHLFLNNLSKRNNFKLKKSDEIALDIVKKTFVLEKKEENKDKSQQLNLVELESSRWTDFSPTIPDLIRLYEDTL